MKMRCIVTEMVDAVCSMPESGDIEPALPPIETTGNNGQGVVY